MRRSLYRSSGSCRRFVAGLAILIAGFTHDGRAQDFTVSIDSIWVEQSDLYLGFHTDSLLNEERLETMARGMTSAAKFRVQLWQERWLFGSIVTEQVYEVKTRFDQWEEKYVVETLQERRITRSLPFVRRAWEQHPLVLLADSSQLRPDHRYYIVIEVLLEPVSRESLQEIRGWLAGEFKSADRADSIAVEEDGETNEENSRSSSFRDRLLNLFVDMTGFGEQTVTIRSDTFKIREDRVEFR